eukprot:TRINITY_DN38595_c0_g1_i1.p1 TRINITY_DN38595_c0_g1~~TRINITY_DN38595_c0_g1_i1.p1  ORF type:complete len:370 (+),score=74.17 TRINITY_DN38595_c0_g1_i1:107-1111(+)
MFMAAFLPPATAQLMRLEKDHGHRPSAVIEDVSTDHVARAPASDGPGSAQVEDDYGESKSSRGRSHSHLQRSSTKLHRRRRPSLVATVEKKPRKEASRFAPGDPADDVKPNEEDTSEDKDRAAEEEDAEEREETEEKVQRNIARASHKYARRQYEKDQKKRAEVEKRRARRAKKNNAQKSKRAHEHHRGSDAAEEKPQKGKLVERISKERRSSNKDDDAQKGDQARAEVPTKEDGAIARHSDNSGEEPANQALDSDVEDAMQNENASPEEDVSASGVDPANENTADLAQTEQAEEGSSSNEEEEEASPTPWRSDQAPPSGGDLLRQDSPGQILK